MVSFQKLPELSDKSPRKRAETQDTGTLMPTKKRRSSEESIRVQQFLDEKRWTSHNTPSLLIDVDLRLETPLNAMPWMTNRNTLQVSSSSPIDSFFYN